MVGSWATSDDQHSRFAYYCILYFLFTFLSSLCVAARVASLQYFSWHGAKKLHEKMIERILNAPINLYFDTTPTGRIINRFTKDLQPVEVAMVYNMGTCYQNLYSLLATMVMSVIVVPWIALFFPVVLLILITLYKHSISATKEVKRIESVTKSPLLSF